MAARGFNHLEIAGALDVRPLDILKLAYARTIAIRRAGVTHESSERRGRKPNGWAKFAELAQSGKTTPEIAAATGAQYQTVRLALQRMGIKPNPAPKGKRHAPTGPSNPYRAAQMATMYRQGITLEKIGQHFSLTRERVRQIIAKQGIRGADGGQSKVAKNRLAAVVKSREAQSMARWGLSCEQMNSHRASGLLKAFSHQRASAAGRGIVWELTFCDWLDVWEQSGKLALRGRGKGRYVMSRIQDEGGYVLGNVHVQLGTDNNSQGLKKCRSRKPEFVGVWCIYPGTSKPWLAKVARQQIGRFATAKEAGDARAAYLRDNPTKHVRTGLPYTVIQRKSGPRYQVCAGSVYLGTFTSQEAAVDARNAALVQTSEGG